MKLKRLKILFFLHLQHLPMPSRKWRPLIVKIGGGVIVKNPSKTFIDEDVMFDTNYPENITIEEGVRLTSGCKIVSHFLVSGENRYLRGNVHICEGAYLGMNVLIVKPVRIGKRAVVGAGSIVTKNIPDYEVWAGNPARFIKKIK